MTCFFFLMEDKASFYRGALYTRPRGQEGVCPSVFCAPPKECLVIEDHFDHTSNMLLLVSGFDGALADRCVCVYVYKLSHFLLRKSGTVIYAHEFFLFRGLEEKKKTRFLSNGLRLPSFSPPPKKVLCENAYRPS